MYVCIYMCVFIHTRVSEPRRRHALVPHAQRIRNSIQTHAHSAQYNHMHAHTHADARVRPTMQKCAHTLAGQRRWLCVLAARVHTHRAHVDTPSILAREVAHACGHASKQACAHTRVDRSICSARICTSTPKDTRQTQDARYIYAHTPAKHKAQGISTQHMRIQRRLPYADAYVRDCARLCLPVHRIASQVIALNVRTHTRRRVHSYTNNVDNACPYAYPYQYQYPYAYPYACPYAFVTYAMACKGGRRRGELHRCTHVNS